MEDPATGSVVERSPIARGAPPRRVLFVGAFPPAGRSVFGGNVTACRALLGSSFSSRLDLDLIDSTQISNPPPGFLVRAILASRRFLVYLLHFERRKPDAVLLFTSAGASVAEKGLMSWYARLRGVPALLFPRGGRLIEGYAKSRMTALLVKFAFGGAEKILCQGTAWQRFAVEHFGFEENDCPVITNWTASESLLAIGEVRLEQPPGRPPRFLFVGWLDREKGVLELLDACRLLANSGREFMLDLVGEGNASGEAREFVKTHGIQNLIRFHGWLSGSALEQRYQESDVFVLPSWAEGLPNAMIEAMAAGLSIVSTPVGNIPDVIRNGITGLLVPPRDSQALAESLSTLLEDPRLRYSLAAAAYADARRRFSVEPAVDRLICVIEEASCGSGL